MLVPQPLTLPQGVDLRARLVYNRGVRQSKTATLKSLRAMARTLSMPSVRKLLKTAGFDMSAVVEQSRGQIEIGYLDLEEGRVDISDYERTEQAATVAGELLGWGGYKTGYGTWVLKANYQRNPLVAANID